MARAENNRHGMSNRYIRFRCGKHSAWGSCTGCSQFSSLIFLASIHRSEGGEVKWISTVGTKRYGLIRFRNRKLGEVSKEAW